MKKSVCFMALLFVVASLFAADFRVADGFQRRNESELVISNLCPKEIVLVSFEKQQTNRKYWETQGKVSGFQNPETFTVKLKKGDKKSFYVKKGISFRLTLLDSKGDSHITDVSPDSQNIFRIEDNEFELTILSKVNNPLRILILKLTLIPLGTAIIIELILFVLWKFKNSVYIQFKKRMKLFFRSPKNWGIVFMAASLLFFFQKCNVQIEGARWWFQKRSLDLHLNLYSALFAFVFGLILYVKGLISIDFLNSENEEPGKILLFIVQFLLNFAVLTAFFTIVLNPVSGHENLFVKLMDLMGNLTWVCGLVCGVILFGGKSTAYISSFLLMIILIVKAHSRLSLASEAMGYSGWCFIAFAILGIILQGTVNLKNLVEDFHHNSVFGIVYTKKVFESVEECKNTPRKIVKKSKKSYKRKPKQQVLQKD